MVDKDGRATRPRDEEGRYKRGSRYGPPLGLRLDIETDAKLRERLGIVGDDSKEARAIIRTWIREAVAARLDSEAAE